MGGITSLAEIPLTPTPSPRKEGKGKRQSISSETKSESSLKSSQQSFYWRATLCMVALYIFAYSVFTIGRYERYNATGFDLATYDQVLWRTAHGDLMGVSIEGNNVTNWAIHVEPILLLLAPLTLVFSDTRSLLVLQTIALATAAIPVYRIAVR